MAYATKPMESTSKRVRETRDKSIGVVSELNSSYSVHEIQVNYVVEMLRSVCDGDVEAVKNAIKIGVDIDASLSDKITALILACKGKSTTIVKLLLHHKANPNIVDVYGNTPLMIALGEGDEQTVQELISHGACVHHTNVLGETALHVAAMKGLDHCISLLIEQHADIDCRDLKQMTPLLRCCQHDNKDGTLQLLINKGADVAAEDVSGCNALELAAKSGRAEYVKSLVQAKVKVNHLNKKGGTALMKAASSNRLKFVKKLVRYGANVNLRDKFSHTALIYACLEGNLNISKFLLSSDAKAEADIADNEGNTALMHACKAGNLDTAAYLIQHRARIMMVNVNGQSALDFAIQGNLKEIVNLLLAGHKRRVSDDPIDFPDRQKRLSQLLKACKHYDNDILKMLVHNGSDVSLKDDAGSTPLIICAHKGNVEAVSILIEADADINASDGRGNTALMSASRSGWLKVVQLLIEKVTDINQTNDEGYSALHFAALKGNDQIVSMLLAKGANVNKQASDGHTPLTVASKNGHATIVRDLLDHAAEPSFKTTQGFTALHFSADNGHMEVTNILLSDEPFEKADANGPNASASYACRHCSHDAGSIESNKSCLGISDINGVTPFMLCCMNGNIDILQLFFAEEFDVNGSTLLGKTALHFAVLGHHEPVVTALLNNGAWVDVGDCGGTTALMLAARASDTIVLDILLSYDAKLERRDSKGWTALMHCSEVGNIDCMKKLLNYKADLESKTVTGDTALSICAVNGHKDAVLLLLDSGANANVQNETGISPLMLAIGQRDIVQVLLNQSINVDLSLAIEGNTALHFATVKGDAEAVIALIDMDADVNSKNIYLRTPLHLAVLHGQDRIAFLLVRNGADIDATDKHGNTALMYSVYKSNQLVLRILLAAGAETKITNNRNKAALHTCVKYASCICLDILLSRGLCQDSQIMEAKEVARLKGRDEVLKTIAQHMTHPIKYLPEAFDDLEAEIEVQDENTLSHSIRMNPQRHLVQKPLAATTQRNIVCNFKFYIEQVKYMSGGGISIGSDIENEANNN